MNTHLIFLAATYKEHEMTEDSPLLIDDLRSVSACHIRLGASKEEFIHCESWVFLENDNDAVEDMCVKLNAWSFSAQSPPLIFAFDAPYLVRRIAGFSAKRGLRFIPAVWWAGGPTSRTFDLCRYLSADAQTTPLEILQFLKIEALPVYRPHEDALLDLKYLLDISDRFNLLNERIESSLLGAVELSTPVIEQALKPQTKKVKAKVLSSV